MSDRAVVVLAVSAWLGANAAVPVPWPIPAAAVALGLISGRPWLLCVGVLILASGLAATARAGLVSQPSGPVDGEVVLLTDPERFDDELRVEVRWRGRHLEAWASGSAADDLAGRLAGDRVDLEGRSRSFETVDDRHLSRHLAGRLDVAVVRSWRPGPIPYRIANGYRNLLTRGAAGLDRGERSLLAGLALGDDREQSPAMVDAFRGSGLTHLLAVSGQNVAFVLLIVEPVLRRIPQGGRVGVVLIVLLLFGLVTRFEPSVLRATMMAAIAVGSTAIGRPAGGRRGLALAVALLLLIDPLLVHSVGFRLSVAASAGIIAWAGSITAWLRGPAWVRRPIGVIVAAQLAVAPVLIATFGPLPMASFPGNVMAGPAAGPAMVWGMTGGALAGVVPPWMASLLHVPTRLLLGWIGLVARVASGLPLGGLTALSLGLLIVGVSVRRTVLRRTGTGLLAVALLLPVVVAFGSPVPLRVGLQGASLWRSGTDAILVIHDDVRPVVLLADLRAARVRGLDLIAAEVAPDEDVILALRERFGSVPLLASSGPAPVASLGGPGDVVAVGSLSVVVRVGGAAPVLDVVPVPSEGAHSWVKGDRSRQLRSHRASGVGASSLRRHPSCAGDGHSQPDARLVLRPGSLLGLRRLSLEGSGSGR